jgi:D-3-phosphoglycerate dehydrogenase
VTYTPDAPAPAVAELTLGLILSLLRDIALADRMMHRGEWQRLVGRRVDESTIGVVGVGRVGSRVIRMVRGAFPSARILANDLEPDMELFSSARVEWVDKDVLYHESDVVTIHVPLTPVTSGMIGLPELQQMKPDAVLINTSRGGIVKEDDLAAALRKGIIGRAGVDVFENEPYDGPLSAIDGCVLTCHMGSMSLDCRRAMEAGAVEEAIRYFENKAPRTPVPEFEYEAARSFREDHRKIER